MMMIMMMVVILSVTLEMKRYNMQMTVMTAMMTLTLPQRAYWNQPVAAGC